MKKQHCLQAPTGNKRPLVGGFHSQIGSCGHWCPLELSRKDQKPNDQLLLPRVFLSVCLSIFLLSPMQSQSSQEKKLTMKIEMY